MFNIDDLGVWPQMETAIYSDEKHDLPTDCDSLYEACERAFWALDPDKLDNLFHLKTICCVQVKRALGGNIKRELHTGYRALKFQLKRPPTWAELKAAAVGKSYSWVYYD